MTGNVRLQYSAASIDEFLTDNEMKAGMNGTGRAADAARGESGSDGARFMDVANILMNNMGP